MKRWLLMLLVVSFCVTEAGAQSLHEHYRALTALPHRLAGSEHGRAAGDVILQGLRDAGFSNDDITVQTFTVTQLAMKPGDCYVQRAGQRHEMQPLRPNGLALPVTPATGITAPAVYLHDGEWEHFRNITVRDRVAVLDWDCDDRWLRAFDEGAKAVVFVGPAKQVNNTRRWLYAHAPLPRYFVTAENAQAAGLLDGATVTLFCRMSYTTGEARNIFAFIPGTGPAGETIGLACSYDSYGPMPLASRSTRRAANVAGLIDLAEQLHRRPVARPTMVAFFDAGAQDGLGQIMFEFARARTGTDPASFQALIEQRQDERSFLDAKLSALEDGRAVVEGRDLSAAAELERTELLRHYEQLYNSLRDERMDLMLDRTNPAITPARAAELDALIAGLSERREVMASLRRGVIAQRIGDGDVALFNQTLEDRRQRLRARLTEIAAEIRDFDSHQALGRRLAGRALPAMVFLDLAPASVRWTIGVPSASTQTHLAWSRASGAFGASLERPKLITSVLLAQWTSGLADDAGILAAWPMFGGAPRPVYDDRRADWRVCGRSHFVLNLGSTGVAWPDRGSPDEPASDMTAYARQLSDVTDFIARLAGRDELSRIQTPVKPDDLGRFVVPQWLPGQKRFRGNFVLRYGGGSVDAELPADHAVVLARSAGVLAMPDQPDLEWGYLTTASTHGAFSAWNETGDTWTGWLSAAMLDSQGQVRSISQFHPDKSFAATGAWGAAGMYFLDRENILPVFDALPLTLRHVHEPFGELKPGGIVRLIAGVNNMPLIKLNLSFDQSTAAAWLDKARHYKLIHGGMLLLNNNADDPAGDGFMPDGRVRDAPLAASADTITLNENRLGNLRQYGISQNALELLHLRAEHHLEQARKVEASDPGAARAHHAAALGYATLTYQPVRDVTNDLIKAVVILLLLAIPFAFSLERLILGSPNVYRQIAAFGGIFLAVFFVLYFVHPAFRFATFPVVVLLAFVIIIMSGLVILIMWGKFEHEVKTMQGIATASHRSTRSHRNTIAAAVSLGISTMRRRPLRTVLTATTIVLLTFTMLFFGSFTAEGGARHVYVGPAGGPRQVEVSLPGASALTSATVASLRTLFADEAESYIRTWRKGEGHALLAGRGPKDNVFMLEGWATLNPHDLAMLPGLTTTLNGDLDGMARDGGVMLPAKVAEALGATPGSIIQLLGRSWTFRGIFDPEAIKSIRTLSGLSIIPPNIEEMERLLAQQNPGDPAGQKQKLREMDTAAFPLADAHAIALVWDPRQSLESPAHSLVFLPRTDRGAAEIAETVATLLDMPVTVSSAGQLERVLYGSRLAFSGWSRLVVPLLLGGLIIFSTMLSSVSDREREIFTFSAVGLAPTHVAILFFAEAAVYSVIGGMGGYLFAQVFGKTAEGLARLGWITAPAMNYSSMNAMAAILVVMLTVLVSTIYPAYRASRSANPGVQRRWRMPPPDGDRYSIPFPFTVSEYDVIGLVTFLEEYFLANKDRTVGAFAADKVQLNRVGDRFELAARVWLQPFDQGVSQTFKLRTTPSDIPGIDEVKIEIERLSGSPMIWQRSNKLFVHDIRQQFIFWRTIGQEMQEHYHAQTEKRFELQTI